MSKAEMYRSIVAKLTEDPNLLSDFVLDDDLSETESLDDSLFETESIDDDWDDTPKIYKYCLLTVCVEDPQEGLLFPEIILDRDIVVNDLTTKLNIPDNTCIRDIIDDYYPIDQEDERPIIVRWKGYDILLSKSWLITDNEVTKHNNRVLTDSITFVPPNTVLHQYNACVSNFIDDIINTGETLRVLKLPPIGYGWFGEFILDFMETNNIKYELTDHVLHGTHPVRTTPSLMTLYIQDYNNIWRLDADCGHTKIRLYTDRYHVKKYDSLRSLLDSLSEHTKGMYFIERPTSYYDVTIEH